MLQTVLLGVVCLALIVIIVRHFSAMKALDFYGKQGFTVFPGARTFFLGNANIVSRWDALRAEQS